MPDLNEPDQKTSLDQSMFFFGTVSIGLFLLCLGTYSISFILLPSITEQPSFTNQPWPGMNRIGSSYPVVIGLFYVFLLVIYGVKWAVLEYSPKELAPLYYAWLVAVSLPFVWLALSMAWYNPFVYRIACWFGDPINIWFIPTVTFVIDWRRGKNISTWWYLARSVIEIIVIGTLWQILWITLLFVIGWYEL